MAQPADTSQLQPQELLKHNVAAWIVLGIVLLLTFVVWQLFNAHLEERINDRLIHRAESSREALLLRLQAYEQMLQGGRALYAANKAVTRKEWADYVIALDLDHSLPGIQGTGITLMVPAEQRDAHENGIRNEGYPNYQIHPPGTRDPYSSIVYLEPLSERNQRAFGYDMYADPVRREAMEHARDTGQPGLSGRVVLVQETADDIQPGFLMYLPIYRGPATDPLTRRASLIGFVFSPFRAHDMMRGLFGDAPRDVEIELFDRAPRPENLLFSSLDSSHSPRYTTQMEIQFGGRTWLARFSSSPRFERDAQSAEAPLILIAGVATDFMLFALMYGSARHRRHISLAAARLEQSRDEFRTLVENVPGVVFRTAATPPWTVIHVSRGVQDMFGKPPEYFINEGHAIGDLAHPDDRSRLHDVAQAAISRNTPYEVEFRIVNKSVGLRWVFARGQTHFDHRGRPKWVDGVIVDITERRAAEAAIRSLAFMDSLTQLPNRRFLMDRLRQGMANSDRNQRFGALLFIDLDHFKLVNDTLGHDAGDALLVEVASRLRNNVREGDTVARLGGDEFIVMLEDLGGSDDEAGNKAEHIATKVLNALNLPHQIGEHAVTTTPSIGIATFRGQDPDADELLRRADRAMYSAKAGGRNRVCRLDATHQSSHEPGAPPAA